MIPALPPSFFFSFLAFAPDGSFLGRLAKFPAGEAIGYGVPSSLLSRRTPIVVTIRSVRTRSRLTNGTGAPRDPLSKQTNQGKTKSVVSKRKHARYIHRNVMSSNASKKKSWCGATNKLRPKDKPDSEKPPGSPKSYRRPFQLPSSPPSTDHSKGEHKASHYRESASRQAVFLFPCNDVSNAPPKATPTFVPPRGLFQGREERPVHHVSVGPDG